MTIQIDPSVFKQYPDLKLGVVVAKGLGEEKEKGSALKVLRTAEKEALAKYATCDLGKVDVLSDWREAYRSFGFKPSMGRCSIDALLRRVVKKNPLADIHPIVNLYNAVSLLHTLPVGGDDLDKLQGKLCLTFASGQEDFTPIGKDSKEHPLKGEVVYCDDEKITCRALNYRECDQTKLDNTTKNLLLTIEGLTHTSHKQIANALQELASLFQDHFGGEYTLYLLDKDHPRIDSQTLLENWTLPSQEQVPHYHKEEAFQTRKNKLDEILEMGIDPYPPQFTPSKTVEAILEEFDQDEVGGFDQAQESKAPSISLAGRIILFRPMGTNLFGQILDEQSSIQFLCNKTHTQVDGLPSDVPAVKFIEKKLDLGDFIGIEGHLFRTNKGELTLYVKRLTLLCKSLLPLPDKHKGLIDKGVRYRKRWLDLIAHKEVADQLCLRSRIVSIIRKYYEEHEFIEVETPILQNIYGGAAAKPFVTHHNALSQDMFCRIALEIALKKLIVGGMRRVYEIGKVFRNEGVDRTHNPEFTMLEAYSAYWDYNDVMAFVENMYERLALEIFGSTQLRKRLDPQGNSHDIDLKTPWIRMTMKEAILKYGKIDVDSLSKEQMQQKLQGKIDPKKLKDARKGHLIAMLFEEYAEEHLIQPHHIIDHPIETTPLCKLHRDPHERKEGIVERFESFILGVECCNAYTELNDPILQRELLCGQAKDQAKGDEEANPMDEEFIEAICQGMPPTGGLGIGIDRLCMLFASVSSIRDVLFFPLMRPGE